MLNIDRVKRVMRAKHGSQILKFLHPSGGFPKLKPFKPFENPEGFDLEMYNNLAAFPKEIDWQPNFYTKANEIPTPKLDATDMPLPNNSLSWTPETPLLYQNTPLPLAPKLDMLFETPEGFPEYLKIASEFNVAMENFMKDLKGNKFTYNPNFLRKTSLQKNFLQKVAGGIGNFVKNNPNMVEMGLDFIGNKFSNVENSGFVDTTFLVGDTISNGLMMMNPALGLAGKGIMTAVKGINSIGGKHARDFSINQNTAEQVGGSYGGSMADIYEASTLSGKKYGLFSGGSRRKANRLMNEAEKQQFIMTGIADNAADLRAMINDLNYLNYDFITNGGYDLRYMRAAKSGMKIQDKIDFIKLRHTINNIINLDTKEIEWEPETIIFKTGGIITQDWDIVFELPKEIIECKDGGKTKEELETPEIEETSQKNLIPEGALHKNKHHMEHTEGLTLKGIPVIDNDGEQQAEIELDEIIFTLEVTKKLEELYKEGTDEAAIEAGKLLVKEILFNTDDRTGLIAKCLEGGKL